MSINIGLIGCGYISSKHITALASCTELELVAVSDIQKERMENAINQYKELSNKENNILQYENYTDMLENNDIDAVIICTLSGLHAEMAKISLIAGKHVILEKPMTLSLKEADELIQLADAKGLKIAVCHQMRFKPIMQKIKHLIEEEKIGRPYLGVVSINLNRSVDYYQAANWRGSWEMDGGMLVNQAIHLIDLLQWLLGGVDNVYGEIANFSHIKETEDIAIGFLNFKNQAKGLIEANIISQPSNLGYELTIYGEKGTISLEGPSLNRIKRWHIRGEEIDQEKLQQWLADTNEQVYMYENIIAALQDTHKQPLVNGYEGRKALEICFSIYKSYLNNKTVHLPLKTFSSSTMKMEGGKS